MWWSSKDPSSANLTLVWNFNLKQKKELHISIAEVWPMNINYKVVVFKGLYACFLIVYPSFLNDTRVPQMAYVNPPHSDN